MVNLVNPLCTLSSRATVMMNVANHSVFISLWSRAMVDDCIIMLAGIFCRYFGENELFYFIIQGAEECCYKIHFVHFSFYQDTSVNIIISQQNKCNN